VHFFVDISFKLRYDYITMKVTVTNNNLGRNTMTDLTILANMADDFDAEVTYAKGKLIIELDTLIADLTAARNNVVAGNRIGNISGLVVGASGGKIDGSNMTLIATVRHSRLTADLVEEASALLPELGKTR